MNNPYIETNLFDFRHVKPLHMEPFDWVSLQKVCPLDQMTTQGYTMFAAVFIEIHMPEIIGYHFEGAAGWLLYEGRSKYFGLN